MRQSFGAIEVVGLTEAVMIADIMVKTANVTIVDLELTKGMGFIVIKIIGDVGAVKIAINSGKMKAIADNKYINSTIIARPVEETEKIFIETKKEPQKELAERVKEEVVEEIVKDEIKLEKNLEETEKVKIQTKKGNQKGKISKEKKQIKA